MHVFEFRGADSSSDAGSWLVVIVANNLNEAKKLLRWHMKSQRRTLLKADLVPLNTLPYSGEMVVFSNVESR